MKTKLLILILLCLLSKPVLKAQTMELWGTTSEGGANGDGTIFKADASGNNIQPVYSFIDSLGAYPVGKLLYASTGDFYGVTELGGFDDSCVIHKYNPSTGVYTKIHDFFINITTGFGATSGMIQASDGMLYGLCAGGGANGFGVIYKIDPSTDTYSDIFDFNLSNGSGPRGTLLEADNGLFYGFSLEGGAMGNGVLFSYDPVTGNYSVLKDFNYTDGGSPWFGSLMQASNGLLYGTTTYGGASGYGLIYSFDILTNVYAVVYEFDGTHGANPYSGLVQAPNGLLYGMTYSGGTNFMGVIYSFDISSSTETVLLDFNGANGQTPYRALTLGSNGKLYGCTPSGGSQLAGVAFSYDISSFAYTKLIDFDPSFSRPDCEFTEAPTGSATGVPVVQGNSTIAVFPVPASNSLYVSGIQTGEIIRFFDVAGREFDSRLAPTSGRFVLDISLFPELFFLSTEDGTVKKVIRIK